MARPTSGYYVSGSRVPSVTTIIGNFKSEGGLVHWAWKLGKEGKDYRKERDRAADIGSIAHDLVEIRTKKIRTAHLKGRYISPSLPPMSIKQIRGVYLCSDTVARKAQNCFLAYQNWAKTNDLQIVTTEIPLVSHTFKYGGTFDSVALDGDRSLLDYKTSNAFHFEYMSQLAAYERLWVEEFPCPKCDGLGFASRFFEQREPGMEIQEHLMDFLYPGKECKTCKGTGTTKPFSGGFHLIRFDKEDGTFDHHHWMNIRQGLIQFLLFRLAYENEKEIKRLCRNSPPTTSSEKTKSEIERNEIVRRLTKDFNPDRLKELAEQTQSKAAKSRAEKRKKRAAKKKS